MLTSELGAKVHYVVMQVAVFGSQVVEPLYVSLSCKGDGQRVDGVVTVVETFVPSFDLRAGMRLAFVLECLFMHKSGESVSVDIEVVQDAIVSPRMAEEICHVAR